VCSIIKERTLLLRTVHCNIARCQDAQSAAFCVLTSEGRNTALTSEFFVLLLTVSWISAVCCNANRIACTSTRTHKSVFFYIMTHHTFALCQISNKMQLYTVYLSVNCSTCFGWILHPSSGAQTTIYNIWH